MPGTGRGGEICQHFDSGITKVPGTERGTERGGEICQHSDSGIAKVPGTWDGLDGSEAQEGGSPGQAGAEAAQKCQLALL